MTRLCKTTLENRFNQNMITNGIVSMHVGKTLLDTTRCIYRIQKFATYESKRHNLDDKTEVSPDLKKVG